MTDAVQTWFAARWQSLVDLWLALTAFEQTLHASSLLLFAFFLLLAVTRWGRGWLTIACFVMALMLHLVAAGYAVVYGPKGQTILDRPTHVAVRLSGEVPEDGGAAAGEFGALAPTETPDLVRPSESPYEREQAERERARRDLDEPLPPDDPEVPPPPPREQEGPRRPEDVTRPEDRAEDPSRSPSDQAPERQAESQRNDLIPPDERMDRSDRPEPRRVARAPRLPVELPTDVPPPQPAQPPETAKATPAPSRPTAAAPESRGIALAPSTAPEAAPTAPGPTSNPLSDPLASLPRRRPDRPSPLALRPRPEAGGLPPASSTPPPVPTPSPRPRETGSPLPAPIIPPTASRRRPAPSAPNLSAPAASTGGPTEVAKRPETDTPGKGWRPSRPGSALDDLLPPEETLGRGGPSGRRTRLGPRRRPGVGPTAPLGSDAPPKDEVEGLLARRDADRPSARPDSGDIWRFRTDPDRMRIVLQHGGSTETERAVRDALAWLARHQDPSGFWDADGDFPGPAIETGSDSGVTGLALLAFLGAGHTHKSPGEYQETVARGLAWLIRAQRPDGDLRYAGRIYCHSMATLALSEAYAMTGDERLAGPTQRAVEWLVRAQHPQTGGWRYWPGQEGDTSVFGWVVMTLRSAERVGIEIPAQTKERARGWLDLVTSGDHGELAAYMPGYRPSHAMTAEALVCRQILGFDRSTPAFDAAGQVLLTQKPSRSNYHLYYWYYGTLGMFQLGGDYWERWNSALADTLLSSQVREGDQKGSWGPEQPYGVDGGRVFTTATSALCLEVYYRYVPLYATSGRVDAAAGGAAKPR